MKKSLQSKYFIDIPNDNNTTNSPGGGGGYFLIRGYWGCAAGWGRKFKAGLTIMGLHF